ISSRVKRQEAVWEVLHQHQHKPRKFLETAADRLKSYDPLKGRACAAWSGLRISLSQVLCVCPGGPTAL
uniref:Uncharacterized protein n=1 Tax=Castor canadensis TaxID=51338 RepID=A0A8C0XFB7_CASCN